MLTLAINTSTKICSVCLYSDKEGILAENSLLVKKNHSNIVMPLIDELFKRTELKIEDCDRFAVSIGPGSFTGVRIALAIAKGFALALNKPIFALSELDIIAGNIEGTDFEIIPLIDAKKERVYYRYKESYEVDELKNLLNKLEDKKYIFVGDGAIAYHNIIKEYLKEKAIISSKYNSIGRASILAELSMKRNPENIHILEPQYISLSQAERNKTKL